MYIYHAHNLTYMYKRAYMRIYIHTYMHLLAAGGLAQRRGLAHGRSLALELLCGGHRRFLLLLPLPLARSRSLTLERPRKGGDISGTRASTTVELGGC